MIVLIIVLLVAWLALVIVGFAVKALFWLAMVGVALFVITAAIGAITRTWRRDPRGGRRRDWLYEEVTPLCLQVYQHTVERK